jgi:hypothetical protein
MRKLLALLSTALLAATATAAAAAADPPGNPVVNEPFALPAAPFCGFDVNVDVLANKERSTTTTLADGTIVTRVTGKLVESYTNADSGKTIVRDVSGATTTTARPDGTGHVRWNRRQPADLRPHQPQEHRRTRARDHQRPSDRELHGQHRDRLLALTTPRARPAGERLRSPRGRVTRTDHRGARQPHPA